MSDNIHEGHRGRLKREFLNGTFSDDTPDYKWLEILLFFSIPQKDTNPIAHELINKFGSLSGVLEAPVEEIKSVKGISDNTATLLKLIIPIARKYELQKSRSLFEYSDREHIEQYILKQFFGLEKERIGVLLLNQIGKVIDFRFLGEGDFCEVGVSTREIVKFVLDKNAQSIIIAHNHPKNYALPSADDIAATESLVNTLARLNIRVIDHVIISGNDYVSLAQSRKYSYIFD
ncbi:MAG: hypothetical protein J5766_00090 [Clostridia bacterium]|nr:hypothetical protein [Clostridia bacterium]